MGFIIVLILVGLVLIFAEILLVPGVGIAGVLGLLSMGGSCFYAFMEIGQTTGIIVTVINAALIVALTVWVLRAKTWRRMALETNI
ncbi:MAG: serine protease, partial [Bacteroidales bacterium]|nr:serine protease [Bacteroidales bacterium]